MSEDLGNMYLRNVGSRLDDHTLEAPAWMLIIYHIERMGRQVACIVIGGKEEFIHIFNREIRGIMPLRLTN